MEIREAIECLLESQPLAEDEAEAVMEQIMAGQATPAQIGGFLIALRLKGETVEEITGFASAMRRKAISVRPQPCLMVDTCGTGGDGVGTFNISTTAAFVVAGAGLVVAKHGNRSVSSRCGSADMLEALGVNLNLTPDQIAACIDAVGIGFLYAPLLHPAMKHAIGPRREMGVRTVFNVLGPLTNPAGAQAQVLGVYDPSLTETLANVLHSLGCRDAFVVHGADGLDELSTTGPNQVAELHDGVVRAFTLDALELSIPRATIDDLRGGNAQENAQIVQEVLGGAHGPRRDVVLLNSAAGLVAGGLADSLASGLQMAAGSIDSGRALDKLTALVTLTQTMEPIPA
ncbi:MAG: anthranilate phosphoribosyltransferase [Anaerolineales bacterium]|nr:anthranilate phosphoribosyltransferase [Anaerolineales bacterium]